MKKIGIVCCSNGQRPYMDNEIEALRQMLGKMNIEMQKSPFIYEKDGVRSAFARERADALMKFYIENEVEEIYDISGGDIANEILPYLDFEQIAKSSITFYGYSDLTTVLNAIYTKTGKESGLYQIKHLVKPEQRENDSTFWVKNESQCESFVNDKWDFSYHFLRGTEMEGVVAGGNIRCFLKLAGTEYFPDLEGKILLLEALGGELPQMITYLAWLEQLGAFKKINGVLLGTFTHIEEIGEEERLYEEVLRFSGNLPVAKTGEIGHGRDAKCCMIGRYMSFAIA